MRQFSGSKVCYMKDYVKPSILENNPDHIMFHVGAKDVSSEKIPQVIAQSIVDLTNSVTNDNLQVTISIIAPRNDQWSKKVNEVNKVLLNLCKDVNIPSLSQNTTEVKKNCNNSNLHLRFFEIAGKLCQEFETFL